MTRPQLLEVPAESVVARLAHLSARLPEGTDVSRACRDSPALLSARALPAVPARFGSVEAFVATLDHVDKEESVGAEARAPG